MASGLLVAVAVAGQSFTVPASAGEVCRFAGITDYAGHVGVTTDVAATNGVTRVSVAVTFESTTMFWPHIHYLLEEVSTWRATELESVAVNSRYLLGSHIVRQQWDDFQRGADGLQARRGQARRRAGRRSRPESDRDERRTRRIPLGRPATAEEIAGPILFLASDLANFMTGEIINVNGGSVLCG